MLRQLLLSRQALAKLRGHQLFPKRSNLASMNWRRGLLLAGINLAVALPPVVWLESMDAAFVREHLRRAASNTTAESPATAPSQAPGTSGETFTINPCGMVDGYSVQQQVVGLANIPAEALAGWRDLCPAYWTLSGMLHTGGWAPTPLTMAARRKADIGFLFLLALQWILVGGFPLRRPRRSWGEPGMFITICAGLSAAVVFIRPIDDIAKLFALFAALAWFFWFGLLVWRAICSAWRWATRHRAAIS